MVNTAILHGTRFSTNRTKEILVQFFNDGYVHIPDVLTPNEILALRNKTDELMDDPNLQRRFDPHLGDPRYVETRKHPTTKEDLPRYANARTNSKSS